MLKLIYFFYAMRPKTLIASIAPVLLSSVLCYKFYEFSITIFYLTLAAAVLIQIMTNLINDLYDYRKGADQDNRIGPDRIMQKGYLSEKEMLNGIYCILACVLFIGIYLVNIGGLVIFFIGLSSILFAYLYTATRFSIAYNGLGEIFVFLYFGIIASIGTFYLQTSEYSYQALLIGAIIGFLNINLLVINNLRDYSADKASKKNTLIVKYGIIFGKIEFSGMLVASYIFLYIFSLSQNDLMIFYQTMPISLLAFYLVFKIIYDESFINYKALPVFSLYLLLFTFLLLYNIL